MKSSPNYAAAPLELEGMPPGIPYIIGNEAAERFSFYGMRTILTVFMVNYLWLMNALPGDRMGDAEATKRFHDFVFLVYLTPVLGAFLADFVFGKYRIIMWLSVVYCLGHLALAMMGTIGEAGMWLMAGLWLIAVGSGGIKPCVSAHVGDQFGAKNRHLLPRIFNWFYWSINLGAFASTLITPWLLEWYGPHWAFGVPGVLMALATLIFWLGRWKFVHIPPRGKQVLREIFSREGLKALGKLSAIYVFVAAFWALFDQSGSSWVLQAENMDLRWLGINWLPSQIQALNPIFILTFIPFFAYIVYPLVNRFFPLTPLRKIAIGLFIMVIAFSLIALAQMKIDEGGTPSISWQIIAYVALTASEVMVSIVSLEFSYTQAPRSMKSLVMSLWLFAVASGNLVTAQINGFIQVPNPVATVQAVDGYAIHAGHDGVVDSEDDLRLEFNLDGKMTKLDFAGRDELDLILEEIDRRLAATSYTALSNEEGSALAATHKDPWGNPYRYKVLNRNHVRVWSAGPDGVSPTQWDQGVLLTIARTSDAAPGALAKVLNYLQPDRTWLDRRRGDLGLATEAQIAASGPTVTREYYVGGQVVLEGAAYFWFFTGLMLAAALLFLIVARFYRPKEYFHEEEQEEGDALAVPENA